MAKKIVVEKQEDQTLATALGLPPPDPNKKVYKTQQRVETSLYHLMPAKVWKFDKFTDPQYKSHEHNHKFHTFDSNGRKMVRCIPLAGHFHEMKEIPSTDPNNVSTFVCGPPMVEVRKKVNGKYKKVAVPYMAANPDEGFEGDNHTHEVVYANTQILPARATNLDAVAVESHFANKERPIDGISG